MNHETLFTKIIEQKIPSHKIYEDDDVYAFLDIFPITPGHTLVVPKKPQQFVWDLDDDSYQKVMSVSKKIAQRLKQTLHVAYIGEQIIGVDVPHAHIHLIPFNTPQEFHAIPDQTREPDHAALSELAKKIAF